MANTKKFLDQTGTSYLWSKIKQQLDTKANSTDVTAINTKLGTLPDGKTTFAEWINAVALAAGDATAIEALADRVKDIEDDYLTDSDKTELSDAITALSNVYAGIAYESKVDTLIGSDAGKSTRTIANEELAAQLIPEDAQESLDTLQEIADWIQAHPGDVAAINSAIVSLQNLVGTTSVADQIAAAGHATESAVSAIDGRIGAIEADYLTSTDKSELSDAIDDILDGQTIDSFADVETALAGKQATIPENTYDTYGSAAAAETAAKTYASGLAVNYDVAGAADTVYEAIISLTNSEIDTAIAAGSSSNNENE